MNPYTYKKRRTRRSAQGGVPVPVPASPQSGGGSWLAEICNAQISSSIALAFIVFAAGSTMSLAAVASPEISLNPEVNMVAMAQVGQGRVLGVSTIIDDASLEAGDPAGQISAKPVSYDATLGRWDYNISYAVSNLPGSATLSIGTFTVQSGITASGQTETGAILKPNFVYHVFLWVNDASGNKLKLARLELKTPKGSTTGNPKLPPPCMIPQTNSTSTATSTMPSICLKTTNGVVRCAPNPCRFLMDNKGTEEHGDKKPVPPMTGNTSNSGQGQNSGSQ